MNGFVILGSNSRLSLAELYSTLKEDPIVSSEEAALFENGELFTRELINKLGGIQKLGHIIEKRIHPSAEGLIDIMHDHIVHLGREGKMLFSINVYSLDGSDRYRELLKGKQQIGITLKKKLRSNSVSARFVVTKNTNLSSADTVKTGVLSKGIEFNLFVSEKHVYIGTTVAVQDFHDWSHRDYDRPARDARRGMLPPKLARIMINLSEQDPTQSSILDPFCGSGTVLMEATMLHFAKLYGSDILEKAVEDTEENLEWLAEQGHPLSSIQLRQSTAANTLAVIEPETIDCIVTEPFLGEPRRGRESVEHVESAIEEMVSLYSESFATLVKLLKPGGVLVVASPVHYIQEEAFPVPTDEILLSLGLEEYMPSTEPIIYKRDGQFVGRHIMRFKKPA